jgi:hypothetical protein
MPFPPVFFVKTMAVTTHQRGYISFSRHRLPRLGSRANSHRHSDSGESVHAHDHNGNTAPGTGTDAPTDPEKQKPHPALTTRPATLTWWMSRPLPGRHRSKNQSPHATLLCFSETEALRSAVMEAAVNFYLDDEEWER